MKIVVDLISQEVILAYLASLRPQTKFMALVYSYRGVSAGSEW